MDVSDLTLEQQHIVDADARLLVAAAGAGSGKTHTLVERFVRLLGEHRIDELVAVTFTEAAAAELRERIRRAVMTRPELAHHRAHLDESYVGTIHSLCHRILGEFPLEAGFDGASRILGEDEAIFERLASAAEAMELAAAGDVPGAEAIVAVGEWWTTQQLPQLLEARDDVERAFAAMGATRAEWTAHALALLDDALTAAEHELRGRFEPAIRELVELHIPGRGSGPNEAAMLALARSLDVHGEAWRDAFVSGSKLQLSNLPADSWREAPAAIKERIRVLKGPLETAGKELAATAWQPFEEEALDATWAVRDLFESAVEQYEARKAAIGAIDFLDLERRTAELLRSNATVRSALQARFTHITVDEFQDTNPLQREILGLLTGRVDPVDGEGGALFVVGDARQAIYGFRGGDVRGFEEFCAEAGNDVLPLARSFRTHEALVEALNEVFGRVFASAGQGLEASHQALEGRPGPGPAGPHLIVLHGDDDDEDATSRDAHAVAATIADILARGTPVWDRRAKEYRPARSGDVAILLRRMSQVHTFERALEELGLPYTTPSGTGFYGRQEVMDLGSLLRWLAEPADELALAGVLRSPLFLLDDETLLAVRDADAFDLFRGLRQLANGDGPARDRCAWAFETLRELRQLAATAPAGAVLRRAMELTGFEAAWMGVRGGAQAVANVRKLIGIVRALPDRSLDEIARYLEQRRLLDIRETPAVLDQDDAVRLMTVHAAKGLEFPIVFVPEAHMDPWFAPAGVRWEPGSGVSVSLQPDLEAERAGTGRVRQPALFAMLGARQRERESAEHKRLFYVAATRAGDYLYVSGEGKVGRQAWLPWVEACPLAVHRSVHAAEPQPLAELPAGEPAPVASPLAERPPIIPVRTSTPVTALHDVSPHAGLTHGDGMGRLRGTLAHRAIELRYTGGTRPLAALARELAGWRLDDDITQRLTAEVEAMVAGFAGTALGRRLPGLRHHLELPFAWHWDGAAIHGTIDLAYLDDEGWHVLDFKSDAIEGPDSYAAGRGYFAQLGLYGLALEAATGQRPAIELFWLRRRELVAVRWDDALEAVAEARARLDRGTEVASDEAVDLPAAADVMS